jgi:hypothetical protein
VSAASRLGGRLRPLAWTLFAVATGVLWVVSRGKWSDAIVDTGTEWMYADALSRGRLLYRDLIYWFGPLTPYWQAAFLRAFGPSFGSLAAAGIAGSLAALGALFLALSVVTRRREALLWTGLAVPLLVFMPYAGGSILGMGYRIWHPATFALLGLALACRPARRSGAARAIGVGLLCGLAALSRTEWGLLALAGAVVGLCVLRRPGWLRDAALAAAAAGVLFFGVIGAFVLAAGRGPVLSEAHLFLTGLSPETRRFLWRFARLDDWPQGVAQLFYSAAMWAGAVLVLYRIALGRQGRPGLGKAFAAVVVVLAVSALFGGASLAVLFSAAPLVCLAAIPAGWIRRGRPGGAALCAAGVVGLLSSHRRPFDIGDSPYVGPPLLFALVAAAGLLHLLTVTAKPREVRRRLRNALSTGTVLLIAAAFAGRVAQYSSDDRVPVPGTGGMLTASPRTVREIVATAAAVRAATREDEGLVVFPEGQVVNALSGRANPLRQTLYIPGYLSRDNEASLIEDLSRKRPAAIVLWPRSTDEYGPGTFGEDYGRAVLAWIRENYQRLPEPLPRARARIYLRKGAGRPAPAPPHL